MPNLQPEQALVALRMALPIIQREYQTTRTVIEAIPLNNGDYKPEPIAKTALELAWHIVAAEHRFFSGVAAGALDFTPRPGRKMPRTPRILPPFTGNCSRKIGNCFRTCPANN